MSWYNVLHTDDHPLMDREWGRLIAGENVNFELRLKRPFITGEVVSGEKVEGHTWIIAAAYAEKDLNGTVVGVLGCITLVPSFLLVLKIFWSGLKCYENVDVEVFNLAPSGSHTSVMRHCY